MIHVVNLRKCVNSASKDLSAIIKSFDEKEVSDRNAQGVRKFLHFLEGWSLDATSFDVSNILLTSTDHFRQFDLRKSLRVSKPGELFAEERTQVLAHCIAKV